MMKITIISPYHGGSHQAWAEGIRTYSQHQVQLYTLPARFWKWRMHGGAVTLARRFRDSDIRPDLVVATDMLDLTSFLALTRRRTHDIPTILYMHENQLTYPLPEDGSTGPMRRQLGERDRHYAFINYASMLAADSVLFNSQYHLESFFEALPSFLKHFPEFNELGSIDSLQEKSAVLHVGVDLRRLDTSFPLSATSPDSQPEPLILWNQRWEYDKNPEGFFTVLALLADEGFPFRIAVCGQQYGKRPSSFYKGLDRLSDRVIHVGYAPPEVYRHLLRNAAIVVSTAHHEFFGISIVEAVYSGSFPVLPNRLSYPELLPEEAWEHCLYGSQESLLERLRWVITHPAEAAELTQQWAPQMERFDWSHLGPKYDQLFRRCTSLV